MTENRYNDAAHYYYLLSQQCVQLGRDVPEEPRRKDFFNQQKKYLHLSEIYYAYHMIHRYVEEPFTSQQQVSIQACIFHVIRNSSVSRVCPSLSIHVNFRIPYYSRRAFYGIVCSIL